FAFESSGGTAFDGGVIELSTDGGMTFADVTTFGVNPGYVARLARGGGNALEGRLAFAGRSANYPTLVPLTLDFGTQFAGKSVQLRFRIGSDVNTGNFGWYIDDIDVSGIVNKPFAAFAPEADTCTKKATALIGSVVEALRAAPSTSLAAFDNAQRIMKDIP